MGGRLMTRGGYNFADRYPWIVEAARKVRQTRFVIDDEAVVFGVDGVADFDAPHSRKHDEEVQLYAFDILALDSDDLRGLPPSMRKTNLARLLARRPDGIFVAPFEQGQIGPDLFRAACDMGLEGLVSKRQRPALSGRQVEVLGEDQEPAASGDEPGDGGVRLDSTGPLQLARATERTQSSGRRAASTRWISRSRWALATPRRMRTRAIGK
jgi:hypothetical protein